MIDRSLRALMLAALIGLGLEGSATAEPARTPAPMEVKVVVVANFENGADAGDAPGEFQDWVERHHLDETVPVRGAPDSVRRGKDGLYGVITRHGSHDLEAFVLDPRFDFSHAYWLFTGISGVDPNVASVGSAAWARWVVNGDELREVDDRAIPQGWPYGLWAIGASRPNELPADANHFGSVTDLSDLSMAYPLNPSLAQWAYGLSKSVTLKDDPVLQARRARWTGFPEAQKPPFVLMGETLGGVRYWHGPERTHWAEDWVKLWTGGKGRFVMTNMESQTHQAEMRILARLGLVDAQRIMVLRTASNFTMPPPGQSFTQTMGDEEPGQVPAFDSNERAGAPVVAELLAHWDRYRDHVPGAAQ